MEALIIEKSKTTPNINFDPDRNIMEISGESYPENATEFYIPVIDWLKRFIEEGGSIELSFKMIYFNTSSSKAIYDILDIVNKYHKNEGKAKIYWFYEADDEDIMESGEEFSSGLSVPFDIQSY